MCTLQVGFYFMGISLATVMIMSADKDHFSYILIYLFILLILQSSVYDHAGQAVILIDRALRHLMA